MYNVLVKEVGTRFCLTLFDVHYYRNYLRWWCMINIPRKFIAELRYMIWWVSYSLQIANFLREFSISFPGRLISCQDTRVTILQAEVTYECTMLLPDEVI